MAEKEAVVYTKPTSQIDLETRLKNDNAVAGVVKPTNPGTPDETENLYVGVSQDYQNHANETEAPLSSQKGAQKEAEESFLGAYDKPKINLDRRKALENKKDQKVLDKPITDKVTEQASPLFAADPGTGSVDDDREDEDEDTGTTSPTPSTPATSPTK